MKISEMNHWLISFFNGAFAIAEKKNYDYHPDGVAMLEILETAFESQITVEQDLWGRLKKQQSALRRFLFEGHMETEGPDSRLHDIANYIAILAFWIHNRYRCLQDAVEFVDKNRSCEVYKGETHGMTCFRRIQPHEPCDRCRFLTYLVEQRDASSDWSVERT